MKNGENNADQFVRSNADCTPLKPATIEFDGHRFYAPLHGSASLLYLAALARRGDVLAAELCESLALRVVDIESRNYWPIPSGPSS